MTVKDISNLVPGAKYKFCTMAWLSPFGETEQAESRIREFKRIVFLESAGIGPVPFVQLGCESGARELLAVEVIRNIEPISSH